MLRERGTLDWGGGEECYERVGWVVGGGWSVVGHFGSLGTKHYRGLRALKRIGQPDWNITRLYGRFTHQALVAGMAAASW
ncbi:hypothetical protein E2C01_011982 [Portunus trituberculatus]|uniref:Uncharacterized protein n=1 Tax=Portunus trituberculatus TaxID=210409 RepID=A0A5B7DDB0_PORTR|nr:hypothetical protein [Portunus trituberculatus]